MPKPRRPEKRDTMILWSDLTKEAQDRIQDEMWWTYKECQDKDLEQCPLAHIFDDDSVLNEENREFDNLDV